MPRMTRDQKEDAISEDYRAQFDEFLTPKKGEGQQSKANRLMKAAGLYFRLRETVVGEFQPLQRAEFELAVLGMLGPINCDETTNSESLKDLTTKSGLEQKTIKALFEFKGPETPHSPPSGHKYGSNLTVKSLENMERKDKEKIAQNLLQTRFDLAKNKLERCGIQDNRNQAAFILGHCLFHGDPKELFHGDSKKLSPVLEKYAREISGLDYDRAFHKFLKAIQSLEHPKEFEYWPLGSRLVDD